jgi:hypothetical protein
MSTRDAAQRDDDEVDHSLSRFFASPHRREIMADITFLLDDSSFDELVLQVKVLL